MQITMMKKTGILMIITSIIAAAFINVALVSFKPNNPNNGITLTNIWKFTTGDNADYAKPAFNDEAWKTIRVDTFWERQGYDKYDGIAWYRVRVVLPASLKEKNQLLQAVQLLVGRIDDADETYFNGIKIGGVTGWDFDRS